MQGFRFASVERPLVVTCSGVAISNQELESRSQSVVGVSAMGVWAKRCVRARIERRPFPSELNLYRDAERIIGEPRRSDI